MDLAPLLDTYWFWLESGLPDEARMTLQQELDRLHAASWSTSALRAGDTAPDFALPDSPGGAVRLSDVLREGPVVLKFYRGRWCAFCTLELRAYARSVPSFRALGAEVIALSPQNDEETSFHRERDRLPIHLLTDAHNAIARQFGIVYRVSDELLRLYAAYGIDLARVNVDGDVSLPLPAVFVVAPDRRIHYAWVDPNFGHRAEPESVLDALRALQRA